MKNMKKLVSVLCVMGIVASLTACGQKQEAAQTPDTTATTQTEAPAQEAPAADATSSDIAFPEKTITLIQPWSLGGGPDVITRQIASYGEKLLGQPMIVENKTGGSGTIGMEAFLEAEDDGYTLFCCNGPLFSLTPSFIDTNYSIDDITPIIGIRQTEFVILANPGTTGINTLDDLKNYAKDHKVTYATTGGPGNDSFTMISVLFAKLGFDAEAVPYDGGQDAINALVGGHVDIAIGSPPVYRDYVKEGTLSVLGTFIPDGIDVDGIGHIPSFKEQGIDAEFTGMDYLCVRSSVDPAKQQIIKDFVLQVYADPEFQKFMSDMGMVAWPAEADEIIGMINDQTEAMKEYIPLVQ